LFYGMSFGIGALAGLVSDKVSLGFVAATEHQVCKHLDEHLEQIPQKMKNPAPFSNRCASTKSTTPSPRWKLAVIASRRPSVSA
jgi:demethoxyubiquinone hydroxylase (CLK1/Coq7/Cat5 family)